MAVSRPDQLNPLFSSSEPLIPDPQGHFAVLKLEFYSRVIPTEFSPILFPVGQFFRQLLTLILHDFLLEFSWPTKFSIAWQFDRHILSSFVQITKPMTRIDPSSTQRGQLTTRYGTGYSPRILAKDRMERSWAFLSEAKILNWNFYYTEKREP